MLKYPIIGIFFVINQNILNMGIYSNNINPKYTLDHTFNRKCIYCKTQLSVEHIDKILNVSLLDIERRFYGHKIMMENIHGKFSPTYFKIITELNYENTCLYNCLVCGWWKILEKYWMGADWQMWGVFFGLNGTLRNLNLHDSSTPMWEIRSYLIRNYDKRYNVNPRLFEELVADVYKDFGYHSICTTYSNDGGIDIILSKNNYVIGVQVKRTKNRVKAEHIRSLLGALVVNNFKNGIFVSTSDFQKGAYSISNRHSIELVNGNRFYEQLKEAQVLVNNSFDISQVKFEKLYYDNCYYMNSL